MSPPRRRRARFAWATLALVLAYPATYLVLRVSQHWVLCTSELRTGIEAGDRSTPTRVTLRWIGSDCGSVDEAPDALLDFFAPLSALELDWRTP